LLVPYAVAAGGTMVARAGTFALGAIVRAAGVIGGMARHWRSSSAPSCTWAMPLDGGGRQNGATTALLAFLVLHGVLTVAALSVMRRTIPSAERREHRRWESRWAFSEQQAHSWFWSRV